MSCIGIKDAVDGNIYLTPLSAGVPHDSADLLQIARVAVLNYRGREDPKVMFTELISCFDLFNANQVFVRLDSPPAYPCIIIDTSLRRVWIESRWSQGARVEFKAFAADDVDPPTPRGDRA